MGVCEVDGATSKFIYGLDPLRTGIVKSRSRAWFI